MALPQSMEDRDGLIWYDNQMVAWREAKTHVLTHTLHYGLGVFEGVRAYETKKKGLPFIDYMTIPIVSLIQLIF